VDFEAALGGDKTMNGLELVILGLFFFFAISGAVIGGSILMTRNSGR
jgi:hypothetical protein